MAASLHPESSARGSGCEGKHTGWGSHAPEAPLVAGAQSKCHAPHPPPSCCQHSAVWQRGSTLLWLTLGQCMVDAHAHPSPFLCSPLHIPLGAHTHAMPISPLVAACHLWAAPILVGTHVHVNAPGALMCRHRWWATWLVWGGQGWGVDAKLHLARLNGGLVSMQSGGK